jgi:hypothetical protein
MEKCVTCVTSITATELPRSVIRNASCSTLESVLEMQRQLGHQFGQQRDIECDAGLLPAHR